MTSGVESTAIPAPAEYTPTRHDDLLDDRGRPREGNGGLAATMDVLGLPGLLARRVEVEQAVEDDGVTYDAHSGWRLDPLPMVIDHATWVGLVDGLVQRAELLDAVLADLYGPRNLLRRGVLPPEVVLSHPEFMRAAHGVRLPSSRQLFMAATDLARGADGTWLALADRTQAPSGAGYALENRRVVSRVMPGLYRGEQPERLRGFTQIMRSALNEVSPLTDRTPRVAILSPGADSETAFDQAFLSTVLGHPLVTSEDLTVRGGRLYLRGLGGLEPVDVLLRRVDSLWADPLEGLAHSMLGVPGLLEAARLGTVSVVNPLGSGVLENNGLLAYLEPLAQVLLGEDLKVPGPATFWCGDDTSRSHVLANLDSLVVKPIARGEEPLTVFGRDLDAAAREDLRARIEADPTGWAAQEEVVPATVPVVEADGVSPRPVVLRTFAVASGGRYELMHGALARAAPTAGHSRISNAVGAVAKDVWVLSGGSQPPVMPDVVDEPAPSPTRRRAEPVLSSRTAENLFWLGRYSERAEDTVRMLRVVSDLAEDHAHRTGTAGHDGTRVMLQALTRITMTWPGFTAGEEVVADPAPELLRLAVADEPGTVAFAVGRTVALAQGVRELLSPDTWAVLSSVERQFPIMGRLQLDPHDALGRLQPRLTRVLEGMHALAGLQTESLVRDTGWYFLDAGRRLERALQVVTVLRHTVTMRQRAGVESFVQEATLMMTESVITHRRRYAGRLGTTTSLAGLLELVLQDEDNPRSVAHQLVRLLDDAGHLPTTRPGAAEFASSIQAGLARVREIPLERDGLATALDQLREELSDAAMRLERVHFVHRAPARPMENQQARGDAR